MDKDVSTNADSNIIRKYLELGTTQMPINWWMKKQNTVYLYNGILLNYKKRENYWYAQGWTSKSPVKNLRNKNSILYN